MTKTDMGVVRSGSDKSGGGNIKPPPGGAAKPGGPASSGEMPLGRRGTSTTSRRTEPIRGRRRSPRASGHTAKTPGYRSR